jgi:hypothetical protein
MYKQVSIFASLPAHFIAINGYSVSASLREHFVLTKDCSIFALFLGLRITLRLAVYRQSVRLGDKPLETHDQ